MKRYLVLFALVAILIPATYAIKRQPVRLRPDSLITRPGDMSCPRGCWYDIDCVCCECPKRGK